MSVRPLGAERTRSGAIGPPSSQPGDREANDSGREYHERAPRSASVGRGEYLLLGGDQPRAPGDIDGLRRAQRLPDTNP